MICSPQFGLRALHLPRPVPFGFCRCYAVYFTLVYSPLRYLPFLQLRTYRVRGCWFPVLLFILPVQFAATTFDYALPRLLLLPCSSYTPPRALYPRLPYPYLIALPYYTPPLIRPGLYHHPHHHARIRIYHHHHPVRYYFAGLLPSLTLYYYPVLGMYVLPS